MQAFGDGHPSRVFALTERPSQNFDSGLLRPTGRDLDVAIQGDGWLAVQTPEGEQALTRAGHLSIDADGRLLDSKGNQVVGVNNQPILVPLPYEKLEINADGTIEFRPEGAPVNALEELAVIKMVKTDNQMLTKGEDGLFRRIDAAPMEPALDVQLRRGYLEASNVNVVDEMTHMISQQRRFEMQMKMMKAAEENDRSAETLLRIV